MKNRLVILLLLIMGTSVYAADAAKDLVEKSGVKGGLIVHLGSGDGKLTSALRINDKFLVQGLDRDSAKVTAARKMIQAKGIYGTVSVDVWDGKTLPYSDNLVNLIIAEDLASVTKKEILRVLAPYGVALIMEKGSWTKTVKPWPQEMGEWSHYLQGPGNNPVCPDTLIGPPRGYQWSCGPLWMRSHGFTASFTAMVSGQGRVFYIQDQATRGITQESIPERWTLVARDAFNGVLLWKKLLPMWGVKAWKKSALRYSPKSGEECLVVHKDRVLMTLAFESEVSILDAATGQVLGVCEGTDGFEEMRCENDVAVILAKKGMMAFDIRNARLLWKVDSQVFNMMISNDRVIYYDKSNGGLVCAGLKDGKVIWKNSSVKPKSMMTRGDYVVLGSKLQVLSVETGKLLWSKTDVQVGGSCFISQGQVWTKSQNGKQVISYDLTTGEERSVIDTSDIYSSGHHPRCHPNKASDNFLITSNRGAEFISFTGGEHSANDWVRGACKYGLMPSNGMLYAPPDPCFCYPNQALKGLTVLTPAPKTPLTVVAPESRLHRGPAYKDSSAVVTQKSGSDWPMYRYDNKRSGATTSKVSPQLAQKWQVPLPGPLTPPISGGGKVYVVAKNEHTVYALDSVSGKEVWRYTAGGRIDSAPTLDGDRILFGCADGHAYCLRAKDGALVWRFQAAPSLRLICDDGHLESKWRVHGSMILLDGIVYLTAGRSTFLDGGIWIFGLDAATGEIRYQTNLETTMSRRDDSKGKPFIPAYHIEGAQSDLLVSQNGAIYLGQYKFDKRLVRQETPYMKPVKLKIPEQIRASLNPNREAKNAKLAKKNPFKKILGTPAAYMSTTHPGMLQKYLKEHGGVTFGEQQPGLHMMATHGFLDDSAFNRAFWIYSDVRIGYDANVVNRDARHGELLVTTPEQTFVVRGHPAKAKSYTFKPGKDGFLLTALPNLEAASGKYAMADIRQKGAKPRKVTANWSHQLPLRIRSMVLAGDTLFVCGTPDIADPADPLLAQAAIDGEKGAKLQAYSAADGKKLAEYQLELPAVFDGLIAAGGQLFLSTTDGKVICMGAK